MEREGKMKGKKSTEERERKVSMRNEDRGNGGFHGVEGGWVSLLAFVLYGLVCFLYAISLPSSSLYPPPSVSAAHPP